jgi:hypothetical protein
VACLALINELPESIKNGNPSKKGIPSKVETHQN